MLKVPNRFFGCGERGARRAIRRYRGSMRSPRAVELVSLLLWCPRPHFTLVFSSRATHFFRKICAYWQVSRRSATRGADCGLPGRSEWITYEERSREGMYMKVFLSIAVFAVIFTLTGLLKNVRAAEAEEAMNVKDWRRLSIDDSGNVTYLQTQPPRKKGDHRFAWVLLNFKFPTTPSQSERRLQSLGAKSQKALYEFDCKNERVRVVSLSIYSDSMGLGRVLEFGSTESPNWEFTPPDSVGAIFLNEVCKRQ